MRTLSCTTCDWNSFWEGRQSLPTYLGSTIRGMIAASFRDLVCMTQSSICEGCLLLNRCAYPYIFETPPPLHAPEALRKRFHQAPRPYVFNVPRVYQGEPTLHLGLVLIGRAIDYLPYLGLQPQVPSCPA
jgi:hypothetical protein